MFNLIPFYSQREINPFRDFENEIALLERRMFSPQRSFGFKTDIREAGDKYILDAELAGFKKEDINVDIKQGVLTISAEKNSENSEENANYICRERISGSFKRSFDISGIAEEKISASFKDGILTIDLPKKEIEEPKTIKLDIK